MKSNALSFGMLVALVTGNMIGSGVFLLPASLAQYGWVGLLGWTLTAFGALFLALTFAEYAKSYTAVGGPYAYCRDAYGDFIGFQTAYNYWLALWVGNAAAVVAFVSYLAVFFPIILKQKWLSLTISLGTIWFLTLVNLMGVAFAGILQMVTTVLKILPLLLIAIFGFHQVDLVNMEPTTGNHMNWAALSQAGALTLWSFLGVESATVPSEYVENPHKVIPRATVLGVLITMTVYLSSAFVVMGVLPSATLQASTAPYADAALKLFGHWGQLFVGFGAAVATFGSLNGIILLQGQIPYAASLDGLFPRVFSSVTRSGSPKGGLLISACCISILILLRYQDSLVNQFTFIIKLATFATLIPYLFSSIGLMIFYRAKLSWQRVVISMIAFCYSLWAVIGSGEEIVYLGTIVIFMGLPVYFWIKRDEKALADR